MLERIFFLGFLVCMMTSCSSSKLFDWKTEQQDPDDYTTGLIVPENWQVGETFFAPKIEEAGLPWVWDWRDIPGGLTEVKAQGSCGSCWAFGSTAAFEGAVKIQTGVDLDIAEQDLVSCSSHGSCGGGYFAHKWHVEKGAAYEADYPYTASNSRCKSGVERHEKLTDYAYLGDSSKGPTTEQIKQGIYEYGVVATVVRANSAMKAYKGGIFDGCSNFTTNHLVALVGWDDFSSRGQEGHWFMKNSWGKSWGEEGYMRIPYGCSRVGVTTTIVVYEPGEDMPRFLHDQIFTIKSGEQITIGIDGRAGHSYGWQVDGGPSIRGVSKLTVSPDQTVVYKFIQESPKGRAETLIQVVVED